MAHLHFIGGEKGGVGKSLLARLLAQYFIDHMIDFTGFDSDRSHGALLRFYAAYAAPVAIDRYESLDSIAEAAAAAPDKRIVVDLAAQTYGLLAKWIDDSALTDLAEELGIKMHYWHVMDTGKDSVDLLAQLLDRFGTRLPLVLVLNEVRGDDFEILRRSRLRERAEALGAKVISIRHLPDSTMARIDAYSSSFWAATQAGDKAAGGLGLLERQRLKVWPQRSYEQLQLVDL